jgi:hypothetical protein
MVMLHRSRHEPAPDPFVSLSVQSHLSRVAWEIRRLERDDELWARAHHLRAALHAYDDLLCEASALAGIPIPDGPAPIRRLILESQLQSHGWSW